MKIEKSNNHKWLVLVAVGIGTFMTALDTSVVNTILPLISRTYNREVSHVEWIVTVYLLILSGLLLTFGRLGDLRGHKLFYLSGFGVFILSSLLCAEAGSVQGLILFRAIQALGAAMLAANSPAILTKSFPPEQRGRALGLQATMTYLGLTVGPSFGGWLASRWGWPVVFYINVPIGLVALSLSAWVIQRDLENKTNEKFDVWGAGLFLTGLSLLLLGLNKGHQWGWTSLPILTILLCAMLLLIWFLRLQKRLEYPMLNIHLFKSSAFSLTTCSAVLNYIGVYSVIFLMPFYLIQGHGLTAAQAGFILTAQPVIMAIVAPISGALSDKIGTRYPTMLGMALLTFGLLLLSRLGQDTSEVTIMLSLGVVGLGTGIFISPNNSELMGSAPRARQGIAAGILATARNLGMVLGVGLAGAVYTSVLSHYTVEIKSSLLIDQMTQSGIYQAVRVSYLVAAGVTFLGIITSAIRKKAHTY